MKKFNCIFSATLGCVLLIQSNTLLAQQLPVRTTSIINPFQDHPAAAGTLGCMDLHMGFRNQWSGIEGAPQTAFANLHGQMEGQGDDFHGFGVRVESDDAGAWGYNAVNFSYAYNLRLSNGARLAAGLSAGFFQHRLDMSELIMPEFQVANDPAIYGGNQFIVPTIDASLWYYDRTKFAGFTIQNVTQPSMEKISQFGKLRRHAVFLAGTQVELDGKWMFTPSAQARLGSGVPPSAEILGMMRYDEVVGVGLGYRSQSALIVAAQAKVMDYLTIGYAYEFNVSALSGAAPSTHEIVIGINSCSGRQKGRAIPCPAYN
jgi:type IX secretion system PorP/SprF family membrane protein